VPASPHPVSAKIRQRKPDNFCLAISDITLILAMSVAAAYAAGLR
jgi:hypothetical protein